MMNILATATDTTENLVPIQMETLGLLILAAHLGGKLFERLRLSVVTGQLLGGVLVGPWTLSTLGLMPSGAGYEEAVGSFRFFIFIFVSLVAFSIGEELHLDRLRHVGRSILAICLLQTSLTFLLVTLGLYHIVGLPLVDALIIGAIAVSTSPAMTFVILNRLRIEGRLRNILGSVEILSDVIGVVAFSLFVQIAERYGTDPSAFASLTAARQSLWPVLKNLFLAHVIGAGVFILLRVLIHRHGKPLMTNQAPVAEGSEGLLARMLAEHPSPSSQIFLIVVASVSLGVGVAHYFHLPFLVTAAFAGFLVANLHSHAIFDSLKIDNLAALLNLAFFALLGSTVRFDAFHSSAAAPLPIYAIPAYVLLRAAGKILGTWLGCKIMKEDRKITSCLPYLLLPQASVAAVEAVYAAAILGRPLITAIMLPSIVIFEIVGVLMSDRTLHRWRSWTTGEEEVLRNATQRKTPAHAVERLLAAISPANIILELQTHTKTETIESLVAHAAPLSQSPFDHEEAVQIIKEREKLMSTGMGHSIAIPHGRLLALDQPIVVMARHETGVVFGGMDNEPCRLIVLILSGTRDPDEHVKLLGAMAQLLGSEETRENLLNAPSVAAFFDVIRSAATIKSA